MKHTKGYYKGCYEDLNKTWSCGETMTLKQALDLWWNSIRIRTEKGIVICYKCAYSIYGTYEIGDLPKNSLNKLIKLDNEYDFDSEDYPICYANFVEEN